MADVVRFTVDGPPVPWARPRARIVKPHFKPAFIHFYTQKEQEHYGRAIGTAAMIAMTGKQPIDEACEMSVKAFLPIPTSWSNKQAGLALTGHIRPCTRPDTDNYEKIALDGCNGIVYVDDGRVCTLHAEKHYSDTPRLEIEVRPFQPPTLI